MGGFPSSTVVGGVGEIDKVNAFGQVVERDFVGGAPAVVGGFPGTTVGGFPGTTVGGFPGTTVVGGVSPYATTVSPYAPAISPYAPTVVSGSYAPPVMAGPLSTV